MNEIIIPYTNEVVTLIYLGFLALLIIIPIKIYFDEKEEKKKHE